MKPSERRARMSVRVKDYHFHGEMGRKRAKREQCSQLWSLFFVLPYSIQHADLKLIRFHSDCNAIFSIVVRFLSTASLQPLHSKS